MAAPSGETSQTLDRGLTVLKLLAKSQDGLTVADIADQLGTARPIVYRLLRTLESHNLVSREDLRYLLGFGIAELAGSIRPRLQATVLPILRSLSKLTGSTALLSVADGEHALILLTAEPRDAALHLVMREGARHPLTVGADGIAILAGRPAAPDDTDDVRMARHRGYAVTVGAIQPGAVGVAAPIRVSDWATASLGVVQLGVEISDEVSEAVAPAVISAAHEAATRLSGGVSGKAVNQLHRCTPGKPDAREARVAAGAPDQVSPVSGTPSLPGDGAAGQQAWALRRRNRRSSFGWAVERWSFWPVPTEFSCSP